MGRQYYRIPKHKDIDKIIESVKYNGSFKTSSKTIQWIITYYSELCEKDRDGKLDLF